MIEVVAPGLKWRKRPGAVVAYWVCRSDIAKRGYPLKTQRLWTGADPAAADARRLGETCQRLQGEMLDWHRHAEREHTDHWRTPGFIYFMEAEALDRVKIGYTTNIKRRLEVIQIGCPVRVLLMGTTPGTRAGETHLHAQFDAEHSHGDWFRLTPRLHAFIAANVTEQKETR